MDTYPPAWALSQPLAKVEQRLSFNKGLNAENANKSSSNLIRNIITRQHNITNTKRGGGQCSGCGFLYAPKLLLCMRPLRRRVWKWYRIAFTRLSAPSATDDDDDMAGSDSKTDSRIVKVDVIAQNM